MTVKHRKAMGAVIERVLVEMRSYCEHYQLEHYGSPVGEDAIIGDEGVKVILQGLDRLLVGDLGGLDPATLHRSIHKLAREHNMLDENGNLE